LAPAIRIDLTGPGGTIPAVVALVDSGADSSLFPEAFMGPLGIDKADCDEIDGNAASGKCKYWRWPKGGLGYLTTTFQGQHLRLTAVFGQTEQTLLGREDFFGTFKIGFDHRKKRFRLDPY
jgi:hypothetical protein